MKNDYKLRTDRKTSDMPAYLFWKLQCHLVKLAYKLRRQKLKATQSEHPNN
jgi:hypothetical protein